MDNLDTTGHSADDQVLISSLLALAGNSGQNFVKSVESPANVYLCGECSSEFLTAEECSNHVTSEHSKKIENIKVENVKIIEDVRIEVKCDLKGCPCFFGSQDHLEIHKSCHFEPSGFKCALCLV